VDLVSVGVFVYTGGQPGGTEAEIPGATNEEDGLSRGDSYEETYSLSTVQGDTGMESFVGWG